MSPGVEDYEDFEASLGPGQLDEDSKSGSAQTTQTDSRKGQKSGGIQPDTASFKSDLLNQSGVKAAQWQNKTLGNYRLARVLGDGGMGIVFQAEDVNLHRTVALKVLRRRIKDSRENKDVELFLREARGAASLDHPNIVRIFQIDQHKGWWYIAMEYLEGGSLMNLVKSKGPLEPSRAAMLIADAANGLTEAHANGIVHRDIKPANLMLTRKGTCKVADFGLVKMDDPNDPFRLNSTPVGTPVYIAPEIVMQKAATPASDVYSMSATLYTVLTARPPFKGKTRKDFLEHALKTPPPELRESAPHCSQILGDLIKAGMSKDPKARPNAKAFAATLRSEISASLALEAASQHSSMIMSMPSSAALRSQTSGFVLQSHASGIIHPDMQKKDGFRLPLVLTTAAVGALIVVGVVWMGVLLARLNNRPFDNNQYQAEFAKSQIKRDLRVQALRKEREDMIGIKAEAELRWDRAAKVKRGPGTTTLIEKANKHLKMAEGYEKAENYFTAAEEYGSLSKTSSEILLIEQKRSKTEGLKSESDSLKAKAITLGVTSIGASKVTVAWTLITNTLEQAAGEFEQAEFDTANDSYSKAIAKLESMLKDVAKYKKLEELEKTYGNKVETYTLAFLNEFGGDKWENVKDMRAIAMELKSDEQTSDAIAIYQQAIGLLPSANAEAQAKKLSVEQEKQRMRELKVEQLFAKAQKLDQWQTGTLAFPILEEILNLSPDHEGANGLKKKIQGYYKPGVIISTASGMELAFIQNGEFVMGSPVSEEGRDLNERRHKVKITKPFYIGLTEVTQHQWQKVMGDYTAEDGVKPTDVSNGRFIGPEYPVFGVNWHEANEFCNRLSKIESGVTYRLPTEAEWEYACRAGTQSPFWNGPSIRKADANLDTTSPYGGVPMETPLDKIVFVGQYPPNKWGLLDMHGNLAEWCQDWQGNYNIGAVLIDPKGPKEVDPATPYKVARGGSYTDIPANARSAKRTYFAPITRKKYIGFRIAMEVNPALYASKVLNIKSAEVEK